MEQRFLPALKGWVSALSLDEAVMTEEKSRLFFGAEVVGAWPREWPRGRVLEEKERHMTLAFLGSVPLAELKPLLARLPRPPFRFGLVGKCERLLFLPQREPRVVAAEAELFGDEGESLVQFQKELLHFLRKEKYEISDRGFLPHITLARAPFDLQAWKGVQLEVPLLIPSLHLYETTAPLTYASRWCHPLIPPFEELDHTADIAFRIQGESVPMLHLHAQMALAFKYPPLLPFLTEKGEKSLDDVVIALNALIAHADAEIGSPFKAVSFHGELQQLDPHTLAWEMIVDV